MTYTVVAHIRRKLGTTPEHFRTYYDTTHVPLIKSVVGSAFPLTHIRHYVTQNPTKSSDTITKGAESSTSFEPTMYSGEPSCIDFDVITVMTWEDKATFNCFGERLSSKEASEKMTEDNMNFLDPSSIRIYAIEEPVVTERD